MPSVNWLSNEYEYWRHEWRKCRDVSLGQRYVHEGGDLYLPKLGGQSKEEYDAYRLRAPFYNATRRTIDGLSGMVFRKEPTLTAPTGIEAWAENVDFTGQTLHRFAESVLEEQLTTTRGGILVDMPRLFEGDEVRTQAQVDAENQRPFMRHYVAENILDLKVSQRNNIQVVSHVRLLETFVEPRPGNEFEDYWYQDIRVLDFDDAGNYRQRVYRAEDVGSGSRVSSGVGLGLGRGLQSAVGTGSFDLIDEVVPMMNGRPLDFIPFVPIGARGIETSIDRPVLLDLINVNLSHYRTMADLEHGAHFTALPTPYVFGINKDEIPGAIGPNQIWTSTNRDVNVGLLEYTGQGLTALETRQQAKKDEMAALGARMLSPDKAGVEAAETLSIRSSGERSVLASLANGTGQAITRALQIMAEWGAIAQAAVDYQLNTDFMATPMSPQGLTAWVGALQGGSVSRETFFEALKKGELVKADLEIEEERQRLEDDGPDLAGIGEPPPIDDEDGGEDGDDE